MSETRGVNEVPGRDVKRLNPENSPGLGSSRSVDAGLAEGSQPKNYIANSSTNGTCAYPLFLTGVVVVAPSLRPGRTGVKRRKVGLALVTRRRQSLHGLRIDEGRIAVGRQPPVGPAQDDLAGLVDFDLVRLACPPPYIAGHVAIAEFQDMKMQPALERALGRREPLNT